MRQLVIALASLVALGGCEGNPLGGNSISANESSGGGGETSLPADWSGKKLVPMEGSIEGFAFTINVPEGLPRHKGSTADWDDGDSRDEHIPKVYTSTIEIKKITDLKDAKYHATLAANSKNWVREQSRPDSWALTMAEPDKSRIEAITYKMANDTMFIKCKAVQYTTHDGALPSYDKTKRMLETICDSLKPKAAAEQP